MEKKRPCKAKGYTLIEFLMFLVILGGLGFWNWIEIKKTIESNQELAASAVIGRLEIAKNQFDSKSKPEEKIKFDRSKDSDRFAMLAPMMNNISALALTKGTGITEMKINRLGQDVMVTREKTTP